MTNCKKQLKLNLTSPKTVLITSLVVFGMSLGFRIHSASKLAVKNQELEGLYSYKANLEKELALLEYENAKYSGLKFIESEAVRLGFVKLQDSIVTVDLGALSSLAARQ